MKYLLHSITLKSLAVVVASLSLLVSILSIITIAGTSDWIFASEDSWSESRYLEDHNRNVLHMIHTSMETAIALENNDVAVPELLAKDLEQTDDRFLNPRDYAYVPAEYPAYYRGEIQQTARYTRYFAVSDGERILYHSPELDPEQVGDNGKREALIKAMGGLSAVDPIVVDMSEISPYYYGSANSDVRYIVYLPEVSAQNIDGFFGYKTLYEQMQPYKSLLLQIAVLSTLLFILLLIYVWAGAGYRRRPDGSFLQRGEISLSWFDRIPIEIVTLGAFITGTLLLIGAMEIGYQSRVRFPADLIDFRFEFSHVLGLIGILWFSFLALWLTVIVAAVLLLTVIRRVKAKSFWRSSLCGWVVGQVRSAWQWLMKRIAGKPMMLLLLIPYLILILLFLATFAYSRYDGFALLISFLLGVGIFVILPLLIIAHLLYLKQSSMKLTDFSLALASGDDAEVLQAEKLHPDFRPLHENLQKLDQGLQQAVKKQLQADRLKTDLITNVSHDLKTPLTSIINYIDLLKREGLDGPDAGSYLETLDQKANRLKQLTEDLVEASKASSGNLSVEREWLDLIELMRQVGGEFEDKLDRENLTLVVRLPENLQRYMIWSDGRHLWRILENLMENARKYALTGSRVYVSLRLRQDACLLEVKNISSMPIDLSTEDLMERFVRGDSARSSEGSGLGLSITSSLAALLGGSMLLDVRDDVFTAEVVLPFVNAAYPMDEAAAQGENKERQLHEPSFYPEDEGIYTRSITDSVDGVGEDPGAD